VTGTTKSVAARPMRTEWDDAAAHWKAGGRRLWRDASDAVNLMWLAGLALPLRGCRVFKTDLFDEAFAGGLLGWLQEQGAEVAACDLCETVVALASARDPRLRSFAGDVRRIPLAAGSAGAVLSNSTLDHLASLKEADAALREFHRILRPGGKLLLTMDNPFNPLLFLRSLAPALFRKLGLMAFQSGATCGPRRLRRMVEEAGFAVETAGAIFHTPRVAVVWMCHWLERRGRRRLPGWLSRTLTAGERLGRSPLRYLTGHFIAISARRL